MKGIPPNLLGEMDFKWKVVRGHCFVWWLKFWDSILFSLFVLVSGYLDLVLWKRVFFNWGQGHINSGCASTMEGISPNLLGEMDFKWRVVRGHCFVWWLKFWDSILFSLFVLVSGYLDLVLWKLVFLIVVMGTLIRGVQSMRVERHEGCKAWGLQSMRFGKQEVRKMKWTNMRGALWLANSKMGLSNWGGYIANLY